MEGFRPNFSFTEYLNFRVQHFTRVFCKVFLSLYVFYLPKTYALTLDLADTENSVLTEFRVTRVLLVKINPTFGFSDKSNIGFEKDIFLAKF